jgi:hypothetical protein
MITIDHQPQALVTSKNPIPVRLTSDQTTQPNHRFVAGLEMVSASRTVFLSLLEFAMNTHCRFNFQALIDALLDEQTFPLPDIQSTETPGTFTNITSAVLLQWKTEIYEAYGDPAIPEGTAVNIPNTGYNTAWRGGFSYPYWPEEKYAYDWYLGTAATLFWSWKPKVSLIGKNQLEYLTYLLYGPAINIAVAVQIYYTDGTTSGAFNFSDFAAPANSVQRFACGPAQLGLYAIAPAKTIESYEIWLISGASVITEKRKYILDWKKYPGERFLFFRNSLSGFDTVRFVGKGEFVADYKRESAGIDQGIYNNKAGHSKVISNEEQAGLKINTGYISRRDLQWLRDLFLSKEVYMLEKGLLVPVGIVSKKLLNPEESDVNVATVEIENRYTNQVFTPEPQTVTELV